MKHENYEMHDFAKEKSKQVWNRQKGVSGTHSFKLIHIYVAPMVNSWRSESSNISFVVLDKLLFGFPER